MEGNNDEENFDDKIRNILGDIQEDDENYYIKNKFILTSKNIDKKHLKQKNVQYVNIN